MRRRYIDKKFRQKSLAIIAAANEICREYSEAGYDLTLRQLYYQYVSRDLLANNDKNYSMLGGIINDARMAGMLDWDYIVDRTRNLRELSHWNDPADIMESVHRSFRHDKWKQQPNRVEVWIEKDALIGVLEVACNQEDVPFFSCRGYTSASEVWGAAQRLEQHILNGQRAVILHLGDHDPSGIDMTRDVYDRLRLFIVHDLQHSGWSFEEAKDAVVNAFDVRRIALNMDQIDEYNPPPNPAKMTDSRFRQYVEEHGDECWELDALPPDVLVELIRSNIAAERDDDVWHDALQAEVHEPLFA